MTSNQFGLTGKTVLVTGASSGIGRQCAITCSEMGASVILLARNTDRLHDTLTKMSSPDRHYIVSADLTDYSSVHEKVKEAIGKLGPVNGVLHCAGVSGTLPIRVTGMDKVEEMFRNNVFSAYNLTKEICKAGCFAKEGGSIVFLSSIMGHVGEVGKSLYSMTKGALLSGVRSLACELAKKNIRVNSISPGVVITPINRNLPHIANPEKRAALESAHLLGLGKVEDIANACVFLLSDASGWITGTDLKVDGGFTAR